MAKQDDSFWLGWEAALEATSNAVLALLAMGFNSHSKCADVLLDVQNSIKELEKIREQTIADLTRIAG